MKMIVACLCLVLLAGCSNKTKGHIGTTEITQKDYEEARKKAHNKYYKLNKQSKKDEDLMERK